MTEKLRHALAGVAIAVALAATPAQAAKTTLDESGSTLLYPLFQAWIVGYKSAEPNIEITAAATGSTAGTDAAVAGSVRIGLPGRSAMSASATPTRSPKPVLALR